MLGIRDRKGGPVIIWMLFLEMSTVSLPRMHHSNVVIIIILGSIDSNIFFVNLIIIFQGQIITPIIFWQFHPQIPRNILLTSFRLGFWPRPKVQVQPIYLYLMYIYGFFALLCVLLFYKPSKAIKFFPYFNLIFTSIRWYSREENQCLLSTFCCDYPSPTFFTPSFILFIQQIRWVLSQGEVLRKNALDQIYPQPQSNRHLPILLLRSQNLPFLLILLQININLNHIQSYQFPTMRYLSNDMIGFNRPQSSSEFGSSSNCTHRIHCINIKWNMERFITLWI